MRDGVRLAVDLYLPRTMAAGARLPTILLQTRYFRSHRVAWPFSMFWAGFLEPRIARYIRQGYAFVTVDVRGSGASFGTRELEWSPAEVRDGAEIVDWIVAQPWSNGKVGTTGASYEGTASELLLSNRHPAVKAAAVQSGMFDLYADMVFPGGIELAPFVAFWGRATAAQDSNRFSSMLSGFPKLVYRGVKPVAGDSGETLLAEAMKEHLQNFNMPSLTATQKFRTPGDVIEQTGPVAKRELIEQSGAAIYSISGWYDGGLANSAIRRFLSIRTPKSRLILGPWSHQGENLSPFAAKLEDFDRTAEIIRFFDWTLKGVDNGVEREGPVRYYTVGEERWKSAPTWPPPGATSRTLYFAATHALSDRADTASRAADTYAVDLTTGTGQETRWNNLTALDIKHSMPRDRRERDQKLLVYDGAPLAADLEVTGHPMVTLHLESTEPDGAVFVYLEDVDPNGAVHYVTEGELRVIHRRIRPEAAAYTFPGPYRTFAKADAEPLVRGEIATLEFDLLPISYLFRAGHSIRVAIAGADADHFTTVSPSAPVFTVYRDANHPSSIMLPVMPR